MDIGRDTSDTPVKVQSTMGRCDAHCSCKHLKAGRRGGQASVWQGRSQLRAPTRKVRSVRRRVCPFLALEVASYTPQAWEECMHTFIIAYMPQRATDSSISLNPGIRSQKGQCPLYRPDYRCNGGPTSVPGTCIAQPNGGQCWPSTRRSPPSAKGGPELTGATRAPWTE